MFWQFNINNKINNKKIKIKIILKDNFDTLNIMTHSPNRTNSINLSLEDTLSEKINFLCYLATPRILRIKKSKTEITPYVFILIPSELCQSQLIEHYYLEWSDINSMKQVYLFIFFTKNFITILLLFI